MRLIRPRPVPRPLPKVKLRRPPQRFVDLLSAPEDDFRDHVRAIEGAPLFAELQARGIVRRRRVRRSLPAGVYEDRMVEHLTRTAQQYDLDRRRPDWVQLLSAPSALERTQELGRELGVPAGELRPLIRYLRSSADAPPVRTPDEPTAEWEDFTAGSATVDTSAATAIVQEFVARHGLSQHDLVADFLHGELGAAALAAKYHTTEPVVQRVLEAVEQVLSVDAAAGPAAPERRPATAPARHIVARVELADGVPQLRFLEEEGYRLRYVIDPTALRQLAGGERRAAADKLLDELRYINQRHSLLCRLVAHLADHQYRYLASGDEADLRPLSQADIARTLHEHQSTVSRVIRDRYLDTPYGTYELQYFCQRKREVIARLAARMPEASDTELQRALQERYGCRIARRTVAYHRTPSRKASQSRRRPQ